MRQCVRNLTPYLVFMMAIITLGPLLFGFHLVCFSARPHASPYPSQHYQLLTYIFPRPSLMPQKTT